MKVLILSTVLEGLNKKTKTIYGLCGSESIVFASLKPKLGLKKMVFKSLGKNLLKAIESGEKNFLLEQKTFNEIVGYGVINYKTDFQNRNHGIIDESTLQEKTVMIIGLGSGGSTIAIDLVRSGVTNLILVDPDKVGVSNLCRSEYSLTDVGRYKTYAVYDKQVAINPHVEVTRITKCIMKMNYYKLISLIDKADLIIDATDSLQTKVFINGLAYHKKPIIYPSVYEMGKAGDILFTFPKITPCYECVMNSILTQVTEKLGDWDYTTGTTKPMPALIADIKVVASRTVKIALFILADDKSVLEKITKQDSSILFIGNEKDTFIFSDAFQEIWGETKPDPDCLCQSKRESK